MARTPWHLNLNNSSTGRARLACKTFQAKAGWLSRADWARVSENPQPHSPDLCKHCAAALRTDDAKAEKSAAA